MFFGRDGILGLDSSAGEGCSIFTGDGGSRKCQNPYWVCISAEELGLALYIPLPQMVLLDQIRATEPRKLNTDCFLGLSGCNTL